MEERRRMRRQRREKEAGSEQPIDIFGAEPLGIFEPGCATKTASEEGVGNNWWTSSKDLAANCLISSFQVVLLETWRRCEERHLRLRAMPRPRNFLEEMAQMTDRGILWQFPINNEQGIDQEKVSGELRGH